MWVPKVVRFITWYFNGRLTENDHSNVAPMKICKVYYKEKVNASFEVQAMVSLLSLLILLYTYDAYIDNVYIIKSLFNVECYCCIFMMSLDPYHR